MAKVIGNTVGTPNPRPDWNQTDETKADYIKNKPETATVIDETSTDEQYSTAKAVYTAISEEDNYVNDNFANAIKGNVSGSFIKVDDVSPIEHNLSVKVGTSNAMVSRYGKNLFSGFNEETKNGVTLSKVDDYYVINGTATASGNFMVFNVHFDAGTYTLSANNPQTVGSGSALIQIYSPSNQISDFIAPDNRIESSKTITIPTANDYICRIRIQGGMVYDNFIIKPQLEVGAVATEYEPYKGVQVAVSNEDGIVEGLTSYYPSMTLTVDNATIECEYSKDLNKYINQNAEIIVPENVETTNNKVTVIDKTITDDTKYPSAKAVYDLFSTFEPSGGGDVEVSENTDVLFSKHTPFTHIVDDCQDITKWTITNISSEIASVDTTNYIFGVQSLRSDNTMRSTKNTYDLTNNYLVLKLRINSIGTGTKLLLSIGNTSAPSTRVVYELGRGTSWTTPEGWQEIVISSTNYSYGSVDAIDFSNINDLYFMAQTSSGTGTAEVDWNLQYVGTRPKTTNKGIVTFTFDDGWSSQYTGVKLLAEKGITSTIFNIKEGIGREETDELEGSLTLDNLKLLVNTYKTDIEVHGDPAYTNPMWTEDKLRAHWSESQKFIRDNGLGEGKHMAYPNGMFPENIVELAKDYFDSCRTIIPFMPIETLPVADRYRIRAVSGIGEYYELSGTGKNADDLTEEEKNKLSEAEKVKKYIDRVAKNGGWLILVLHKIGENLTDSMYCSEDYLFTIADYAIDSGVDIMNYAEVMERFYADLSPEKNTTISGDNVVIPDNVETTDNKVSTIEDNMTEEKYPTVSAVRDYINQYKHIIPITQDTFIFELEDGIYHVDGNTGATIYFDSGDGDCNLQDGLFLVSYIEDNNTYNWIAIGRNSNGVEGVFTGYTDDSWIATYSVAEKENNKVSIINDITNNHLYYPSVKAVTEYIEEAISTKQDTLVSGTNIKTINSESILGSGDIVVEGSGGNSSGDGLDSTAISLLIPILEEGVYNADVSDKMDELKNFADSGSGSSITVDQEYNPESTNAQSGKAVAEVVSLKLDKILSSPNGTKWSISIDDNGNIVTTKITEEIPATGISLSANTLTFTNSANKTLVATLVPSNSTDVVTWTSSNESVAVVSNGVVTPISNGSTTITAIAGNVSTTCEITVNIASGEATTYTITRNITNATGFDDSTVIGEGSELLECYISDDECTMNGATATVAMGGEDITETAWNNGVVNIAEVTGDVVITLNAVKIEFVVPPITDFTYEIYGTSDLKVTTYNGTESAIELPVTAEVDGKTYNFKPYGLTISSSVEHLKVPEDVTYILASMRIIRGGESTLKTADIYSSDIILESIAHTALEKALQPKDTATTMRNYGGNTAIRTLENVTYPTGITSLHSSYGGLYAGMTGLIYGGTIPSHITTLTRAFYGCSNMRKIRVETTAEGTSASGGAYYQTFYNVQELDIELYVSGGLWNCLRRGPSLKWNYKGIDENIDRVVCFGDSLTAATYPTELLSLLPQNITTHNCGKGGYTSEQIYQVMISDPYCRRLKDDIIVIWHGTNGYGTDGSDGVTAKMIKALDGNERFILIPPTAQGVGDNVYESWVTTYGAEHVLSIGDWFEANGYTVANYLTDGTHFTEEGYALIAQAVYEKIQQYL